MEKPPLPAEKLWNDCSNQNKWRKRNLQTDKSGRSRVLANCAVVGYTLNMKLSVILDRDEDGVWIAECPAIPGCVSQGKTKPQTLINIKEAIALCLEVRAERGIPNS